MLKQAGVTDPICQNQQCFDELDEIDAYHEDKLLTLAEFAKATESMHSMVHKFVAGTLRVPNFGDVADIITQIYKIIAGNSSGHVASYIPELS